MLSCLRVSCLALLVLLSPLTMAHKVIFDVFPSGKLIEGELGFSNGDMARGQIIQVFDPSGALVGQASTDGDGYFVYQPSQGGALVFQADLGAGHVAKTVLSATDVAQVMGLAVVDEVAESVPVEVPAAAPVAHNNQPLQDDLAALSANIKQLRKELKDYKEKNDLQTILGGIGYILGLFGLAFYLAARKQMGPK